LISRIFVTISSLETSIIPKLAQLSLQRLKHPESTVIGFQYISGMIASSIVSNNLHIKHIQPIHAKGVAQVPPWAMLLWGEKKKVQSFVDPADRDDITGSDTEQRLTIVASIMEVLLWRVKPLLDNYNFSSLPYQP
jgi:hypothetical protein